MKFKPHEKIILFGVLFCFIMGVFLSDFPLKEDGIKHYNKAAGKENKIKNYPPVYHLLAGPFAAHSEQSFKIFNALIVSILLPISIYILTKNEWVFFLLFLCLNLPFSTLHWGTYPSTLAVILWILFLCRNDFKGRVFLLSLSYLTHNSAHILIIITWVIIVLEEELKEKNIFLASSLGYVLSEPMNFFREPIGNIEIWLKSLPPICSLIGLFQLIKKKKITYLLIIFASILPSLTRARTLIPLHILLFIGFSDWFKEQDKNTKIILSAGLLLFLAFNFYEYKIKWGY